MDAFTLAAKLTLDSGSFESGLSNAEGKSKGLGSAIKKAISAAKALASALVIKKGIDAMKKLADNAAAAGDKIDKQSQALGMSRKAYQEWDYILSQNGSTIDNLGVSMKTLSSAIVDGSKTGIAAFDKLGLSIDDLRMQDMQIQFENVVKAFQKMPEGAEKAALAVDLFGRNGMELLPLLNNTSASIDELRKKAEELGIVMDDDAVNAAVNYTDAMDTLNRTFEAAKNAIGAVLLPTLTDLATYGAETIGRLTTAFKSEGLSGAIEEAGKIIGELGDKIKTAFDEIDWVQLGTDIVTFIQSAFVGIAGWFGERFTAAKDAIGQINWEGVGTAIKNYVTTGINSIVTDLTNLFNDAAVAIDEINWVEVGTAIRETIQRAVEAISGWFGDLFSGIISDIEGLDWSGLGTAIVDFLKFGLEAIDGLFTGLLGENWDNFKKAFEDLTPVIAGVGAAAFVVAAGFAATKAAMAITDIITKVQTGFSEMFAVIAAHPFMAVITAIVGLGVALVTAYNTNEEFKAKVDKAWETIKTTAQTVWTTVSSAVELAFEAIQKAWDAVSGFFTDTIPEIWNNLKTTAQETWDGIKSNITTAIDTAKSTLETTWGTIQSKAEEIWGALKTAAETSWQAIQGFIEDPIGTAQSTLETAWDDIQSAADTVWSAIQTAAETAWNAIQGFIEDPISAAQKTLGGIWTSIQSAVTEAWTAIKNTITEVINAITTPINDFIGTVSGAVDGVLKFLGLKPAETPDWNSDVNNKITTPMSGASSAIQGLLGEMASLEAKDGKNLASTTSYHTNYEHTIYTFEGSSGQKHTGTEGEFAKAMFGGKILRGATVFGMDDNGPMIGGEAGPEAIVGVNSLDQMIQKSVSNAVSGILAKMDSLISGQGTGNIEIVLDTGELVGAIGGKMDAELGKIGDWKGGGRA